MQISHTRGEGHISGALITLDLILNINNATHILVSSFRFPASMTFSSNLDAAKCNQQMNQGNEHGQIKIDYSIFSIVCIVS